MAWRLNTTLTSLCCFLLTAIGPPDLATADLKTAELLYDIVHLAGRDAFDIHPGDIDEEISPPSEPRACPHCQKGTLVWIGRLPRQGRAPP